MISASTSTYGFAWTSTYPASTWFDDGGGAGDGDDDDNGDSAQGDDEDDGDGDGDGGGGIDADDVDHDGAFGSAAAAAAAAGAVRRDCSSCRIPCRKVVIIRVGGVVLVRVVVVLGGRNSTEESE